MPKIGHCDVLGWAADEVFASVKLHNGQKL